MDGLAVAGAVAVAIGEIGVSKRVRVVSFLYRVCSCIGFPM